MRARIQRLASARTRVTWLAAAAALGSVSPAAAHDRLYELYDWRNGLLNETVKGVAQDPDGFIWVATSSGLLRFDGSEFKRVTTHRAHLLPDRSASGPVLLEEDGVIAALREGRIVPITDALGRTVSRERCWVAASADGTLWIVSADGAECARPDGSRTAVALVTSRGSCRPISPGPDGDIYAWSAGTLLRVSPAGETRAVARMSAPAAALEDAAGRVIATLPDGRIVRAGPDGETTLGSGLGRPLDLVGRGAATCASFDSGLYRIGPDDSLERIGAIGEIPGGEALLVDRESNVWMASGGLYMFPELDTVKLRLDSNRFPRSVAVVDGEPWFGAWWGPFRATRGPEVWQIEALSTGGWSLPCPDARGRIWIAAEGAIQTWESGRLARSAPAPGVGANHRAARSGDAGLWLPTDAGLYWIAADSELPRRVLERFPGSAPDAGASDAEEAPAPPLWRAFESRAGELFLARGGRICRGAAADVLRGAPVSWTCDNFPDSESITGFAELRGVGVLAAVFGLGVFRWQGERWIALGSSAELRTDQPVYGLAPGEDGTVWLLLEQDLVRIGAQAGQPAGYELVERLSPRQGLPGTRVEDLADDGDGGLWLVMQDSAVHLPAAARRRARPPGSMQLVEASVDGRAVDPATPIALPRSRNRLQLRFAPLSYTERSSMRFRLRLHPDEPWEPATTDPAFRFVDLPSGRYDVEAQSSADGVHWLTPGARLRFVVQRAWYLQPWFVGLALVAVAAAALGFHRLRVTTLLGLERQRARIAMDLHDEIGAGLGGIGLLSELAARPATGSARRAELAARAAAISSSLAASLQDIVWSLRPGAARLESLAAHIVERGHLLYADGEPEFLSEIPERLPEVALSLPVRRDVLLIAQEALRNARRHARARAVRVRLEPLGRRWRLSVIDDGTGMPEPLPRASGAGGLGLESMRRRAARIGAELGWSAADGGGTVVTLVFDPRAEDRSAPLERERGGRA